MHRLWVPLAALTTLTTAVFPLQVHSQVSTDSKEAAQAGHLPERSADTPVPALTLAQAMALALQHSPELRAAQQDVQASEGAVITFTFPARRAGNTSMGPRGTGVTPPMDE